MPGTITAIAFLLTELLGAGISISQVLEKVQATGVVPQEAWNELGKEIKDAEAFWKQQGDLGV